MKLRTQKTKAAVVAASAAASLVGLHSGTPLFQGGAAHAQTATAAPVQAPVVPVKTAATPAPAQQQPPPSPEAVQAAVKDIQNAGYFATGEVGIASQISPGENAVRVLLRDKNALVLLRDLLRTSSPAGQLYALLGIGQIAPTEFSERVAEFRTRKTTVTTLKGCLGTSEPVAAVAARIGSHYFEPTEIIMITTPPKAMPAKQKQPPAP